MSPTIRIGQGADGSLTYLVEMSPDALPPVRGRDIELAWHAARRAAIAASWGSPRGFRFRRRDGGFLDLALSDADACCWAGAVDGTVGMGNSYGLSLCLRLLALVDLLTRARWMTELVALTSDGAELHPALLSAAAHMPLTAEARFDEIGFRAHLGKRLGESGHPPARLTGASA